MTALLRKADYRTAPLPHRRVTDAQPHVLVVEDHDDTRALLTFLLEMKGCRVTTAKDGEDAVRAAQQERPDLILMDATLPRLDGLSATRRIRETPSLRDVPVVFLSGHAEESFRAAALAAGDDLIVKPFELNQLGKMLEQHLGQG
jgi:CheY-like chemotaxis protein